MFNFMDFGMPSMYGATGRNSMRAPARPSHRRLDTWGFFDPQPEPEYYYQPRRTVHTRQAPSSSYYNHEDDDDDDAYAAYNHLRRAPRGSVGGYGLPQYYRTAPHEEEEYETEPQAAPVPRTATKQHQKQQQQQQRQLASHRQRHNTAADEDSNEKDAHRPSVTARKPQRPSYQQPDGSLWDACTADPFVRGSQTTANRPEPSINKTPKTSRTAHTDANTDAYNKHAAQDENQQPNTAYKSAPNKPQQHKTSSKPTSQSTTSQQTVMGKVVIKQDKGDYVTIEDVTPPQPKRSPALEPARGLIIEEVRC